MITQEELKKLLYYDPDTGIFTWTRNANHPKVIGMRAGTTDSAGYTKIKIRGKHYRVQRLVFLYMNNTRPVEVDHINGIKTDNRFENLREATRRMNVENQVRARKDNKSSGLLGTHRTINGTFHAHIQVNKKIKYLGSFATAEEAHAAYLAAKRKYHEGCTI